MIRQWQEYRFWTPAVNNPSPIITNLSVAWWVSSEWETGAYIKAYLPIEEDLYDYWPAAQGVREEEVVDEPKFSTRFPKPRNFSVV